MLTLAVVVGGFIYLCLAISHVNRFYAYDEAVYLSQVYSGHAQTFNAQRARGLPWLMWPLGAVDAPLRMVRAYLLALNAGLMCLGFGAWLPVLGRRTAFAAAFFGLSYLAGFEATEVFPNLPVALLGVGAAGYLARSASVSARARWWALGKACLMLAAAGMVRPMEATFITAGLVAGALLLPAAGAQSAAAMLGRRWIALLTGLAIGWLPWLIEAQTRFGGPVQRMRLAALNVSAGPHHHNARHHLGLTDGPLSMAPNAIDGPVPLAGWIWWLVLGVTLLVTILYAVYRTVFPAAVGGIAPVCGAVVGLAGAASAAQYLFFAGVVEARFLVPAYALLAVTAASLLPDMQFRRFTALQGVALASAMVMLTAFGIWQVDVLEHVGGQQDSLRSGARNLARVLTAEAKGKPCYFVSEFTYPVIAFTTGCRGAIFRPQSPLINIREDPGDAPVYILSASDPRRTRVKPLPGTARRLDADGAQGWWLSIAPASQIRVIS